MIEFIQLGNKFILYVGSGRSLIPGVVEATSEVLWKSDIIWYNIFPKRIKVKEFFDASGQ